MNDLVAECQDEVIKFVRERGVVIEINPSSNLRMTRTKNFRDGAYLPLVEKLGDDGLVAINTDNPGIYNTRIEQEYAIVYKGLRDRDMTRTDAMRIMEKIRLAGLSSAY
jgi:adenosine deaminase